MFSENSARAAVKCAGSCSSGVKVDGKLEFRWPQDLATGGTVRQRCVVRRERLQTSSRERARPASARKAAARCTQSAARPHAVQGTGGRRGTCIELAHVRASVSTLLSSVNLILD